MQRLRKRRVNREKAERRAARQRGHKADCLWELGKGAAWQRKGRGTVLPKGRLSIGVERLGMAGEPKN